MIVYVYSSSDYYLSATLAMLPTTKFPNSDVGASVGICWRTPSITVFSLLDSPFFRASACFYASVSFIVLIYI